MASDPEEIKAESTEESSNEPHQLPEVEIAGEYQLIKKTLAEVCAEIDQFFHTDTGSALAVIEPVIIAKNKLDSAQRIWDMEKTGERSVILTRLRTSSQANRNLSWSVFSTILRGPVRDAGGKIVKIGDEIQMKYSVGVSIGGLPRWTSHC